MHSLPRFTELAKFVESVIKKEETNKFDTKKAVLVEGLAKITKTNEAGKVIEIIKKASSVKAKVLVVLANESVKISRFFKNIKDVETVKFSDLNAFLVLRKSLVLIDSAVFEIKASPKATKKETVKKIVKPSPKKTK